jgi:methylenetetrahydrofolate reductase (NADPH)
MAVFSDLEAPRRAVFSFEFFPPRTEQQRLQLDETVARLLPYRPAYVSVTYGAGGSSQERSIGSVREMQRHGLAVAAHMTCAGASRGEVGAMVRAFRSLGVERFVALRGDAPGGPAEPYAPHPAGFSDTAELVGALKRSGATDVAVSAYPEKHPHSADWDSEIAALKRKVEQEPTAPSPSSFSTTTSSKPMSSASGGLGSASRSSPESCRSTALPPCVRLHKGAAPLSRRRWPAASTAST